MGENGCDQSNSLTLSETFTLLIGQLVAHAVTRRGKVGEEYGKRVYATN